MSQSNMSKQKKTSRPKKQNVDVVFSPHFQSSSSDRVSYLNFYSVGSKVKILLNSGDTITGIIHHFAPTNFSVFVEVDGDLKSLKFEEIVDFELFDVDLFTKHEFNKVGGSKFKIDVEISSSSNHRHTAIEKWVPDEPPSTLLEGLSLDDDNDTSTWDQFKDNEEKFGVKASFDEELYTTRINKDDPNYSKRLEVANRMADEIESQSFNGNIHLAEERNVKFDDSGIDEEDKYSGVDRSSSHKKDAISQGDALINSLLNKEKKSFDFSNVKNQKPDTLKYVPLSQRSRSDYIENQIISANLERSPKKSNATEPSAVKSVARSNETTVANPLEKPLVKSIEKPLSKVGEKPLTRSAEKTQHKQADKSAAKITEKPVANIPPKPNIKPAEPPAKPVAQKYLDRGRAEKIHFDSKSEINSLKEFARDFNVNKKFPSMPVDLYDIKLMSKDTHKQENEGFKGEIKPNAKTDVKADTKRTGKREVKADSKHEVKAENKSQARSEVKGEAKSQGKGEGKSQVKSDIKPESKAAPKAEAKQETKAEVKAQAKPEVKAQAKPEVKADAKYQTKSEVKVDTKNQAKSEVKADVKSQAKSQAKSPVKSPSKSPSKSPIKSSAKSQVKHEIKHEAKNEVKHEIKPEIKIETKHEEKKNFKLNPKAASFQPAAIGSPISAITSPMFSRNSPRLGNKRTNVSPNPFFSYPKSPSLDKPRGFNEAFNFFHGCLMEHNLKENKTEFRLEKPFTTPPTWSTQTDDFIKPYKSLFPDPKIPPMAQHQIPNAQMPPQHYQQQPIFPIQQRFMSPLQHSPQQLMYHPQINQFQMPAMIPQQPQASLPLPNQQPFLQISVPQPQEYYQQQQQQRFNNSNRFNNQTAMYPGYNQQHIPQNHGRAPGYKNH